MSPGIENGSGAHGPAPVPDLSGGPLAGSRPDYGATSQGPQEREWDVFASLPKIGLYRTEDHQYFVNGDGPFPSVTTVLGVMQKWELAAYRERRIEDLALRFGNWLEPGDAIAALNAERDLAGTFGTSIHHLADLLGADETALEGFPMTERQREYALSFSGFLGHLRASEGEIASSEKAVYSKINGYAGTYDLILLWHCPQHSRCLWLVDLKTSAGIYPDYALQLAGYVNAEYIVLPGNPELFKMANIDHAAILHVRPDKYPDTGWRLIEYGIGDRDFLAFLGALELWQWKKEGRFGIRQLRKATVQGT